MKKDEQSRFYFRMALVPLLLLLVLFFLPLASTLSYAFKGGLEGLKSVFLSTYTYKLLLFTLEESLLSALISVVLALPFSYLFANYRFFGRKAIIALSALSFTIPSILVVLGFVIYYGNNGFLNQILKELFNLEESPIRFLYSFWAIIGAHVYLNFPVAFNLITNGWESLPRREEEASFTLSKGRLETFFRITLPKLRTTIVNAFVIIFLFCFSSFAIVLVLGGNPKYTTLEAEIYRTARQSLDFEKAAALSLFTFLITSVLLIATGGGRRREKISRKDRMLYRFKNWKGRLLGLLVVLLILLFILPPMLSIVYRSFFDRNGEFSLKEWNKLLSFDKTAEPLINSLILALSSSTIAVLLSESLAIYSVKRNSHIIPTLATLPLATGSVTLGLGYNFLASHLPIYSDTINFLMVVLTHLVLAIPFAIRTILPGAKEIPERIAKASYTLGKGRLYTYLRVERPLLRRYRYKAFIFAFALSLGEVNATLTLSGGNIKTLPVQLYSLIGSYNYQGASVMGTVLLALAFITFLLGEVIGEENGFSRSKES